LLGYEPGVRMSVLGRRLRTVGTAAAACALLVAVSTCGDDAADEATTTSTSETTIASTTTTQDPEAEVQAAYLAYWEMAERLLAAPDPDDPEIARRASGSARAKLVDSLTTLRAQQERLEFGPDNSHRVVAVELGAEVATVLDCIIDHGARISESTGQREEFAATPGLLEVVMAASQGHWVVESISKPPEAEVDARCGA
jgi:hypothetical protein